MGVAGCLQEKPRQHSTDAVHVCAFPAVLFESQDLVSKSRRIFFRGLESGADLLLDAPLAVAEGRAGELGGAGAWVQIVSVLV